MTSFCFVIDEKNLHRKFKSILRKLKKVKEIEKNCVNKNVLLWIKEEKNRLL